MEGGSGMSGMRAVSFLSPVESKSSAGVTGTGAEAGGGVERGDGSSGEPGEGGGGGGENSEEVKSSAGFETDSGSGGVRRGSFADG